jgi:hypothetical protein
VSINVTEVRVRVAVRLAFFQLNVCFHSPYGTSSLTIGSVCSLRLLLGLASAVILRSNSRGTRDHILLSRIRDSPNLEGQVPVFISARNWVARSYPRHWVPFSSPPRPRRATVEVFVPASTRKFEAQICSKQYCSGTPQVTKKRSTRQPGGPHGRTPDGWAVRNEQP